MKEQMQRWISLLLAVVMVIGMVPMQVFATEGTQETEAVEVVTEPAEAPEEETTAPAEETEPSDEEEEEEPSEPSESEEEPEVIHEHDYEAVVTAPTCTEQGYTTYTCECGDSYTSDVVAALGHDFSQSFVCSRCDHVARVSVLGDSISTYAGFSAVKNAVYPNKTIQSVEDTWWKQVVDMMGAQLLVNNASGGSRVLSDEYFNGNGIREGNYAAYRDRCVNLHDGDEKPDVIFVFMGTNDFSYHVDSNCEKCQILLNCSECTAREDGNLNVCSKCRSISGIYSSFCNLPLGIADSVNASAEVPASVCEAYAIMLSKMKAAYPNAQIYCMGLLPRVNPYQNATYHDHGQPTAFNAELKKVAENAGARFISLEQSVDNSASTWNTYFGDAVHPTAIGMEKISAAVLTGVLGKEIYTVSSQIASSAVTMTGEAWAMNGTAYEASVVTVNPDLQFDVRVIMNGVDVTENVFNAQTGRIYIAEVTGNILITVKTEGIFWSIGTISTINGTDVDDYKNRIRTDYISVDEGVTVRASNDAEINVVYFDANYKILSANNNTGWIKAWTSVGAPTAAAYIRVVARATSGTNLTTEYSQNVTITCGHVHDYKSEVTAPTCTEQGYTTYTCECGDSCVADYVDATGHSYENGICTGCGDVATLAGKTLSILGASISTYTGISNNTSSNATIGKNAVYYTEGRHGVYANDTWWMQAANDLGLRLLVNNSWSGSALLHERNGTVGAYVNRCVQLHNNQGEEPDIIAIQMGTNDFQYYKDTLGTADIDYAALIKENADGTFTYATPVTSLEAAAIVLHKISVRYPNAEVYYLNVSQRVDNTDELIRFFNGELKQVVEHFGASIVDIYGSAITMEDFDTYIGDGKAHPNKMGMDAYTEAFKRALAANTNYAVTTHTVSMQLDDVTADYGDDKIVVSGDSYTLNLTASDALDVTVIMGGQDITQTAYHDGKVTIDAVTADVMITAKSVHQNQDYRWEFNGTDLAGENALSKISGTTTDGVFSNTCYALEKAVVLYHDQPWIVEWKCEGTFLNSASSTGARVFSSTAVNAEYNARSIFKSNINGLVTMGEKTTTGSHNYGIALGNYGIDWTALHTYRLENRIADDGSNMVYLFVDGREIGPMNHYYVGTTDQNTTSDWLSGKDFVFPYMGTDTHGFTNAAIEYIAVWEGGHTHTYSNGICTGCGEADPNAAEELALKYDDHYDVTGKTVEIIDAGKPTSYQVGYGVEENKVLDTAVVTLKDNALVATGIGTAEVRIDGVLYEVTVTAAPISLLLLIGQSNMQGIDGNPSESIVCATGQVYATYADRYKKTVEDVTKFAPSALTGEYQTVNVTGDNACLENYPVNMLTEAGNGREGMDSGIAYEWTKQTGEKVWTVNVGYGGSSIKEWQEGGVHYLACLELFKACQDTLRKEIAAGHFTLSHMAYFWCQGCADENQTAEWYVDQFLTMHDTLKSEMAFDEDTTFEFAGIVPIRSGHNWVSSYRAGVYKDTTNVPYYQSFKDLQFNGPRVAQYWMGNNPELTDIWNVCTIQEGWATLPDGTDGVTEYFESAYKDGIVDYPTQVKQSASWYRPTTPAAVHDNIHYNQIGYNELGRESARNALIMLGILPDYDITPTVKFLSWDGFTPAETVTASTTGVSGTLVVPMVYPVSKSKDVTYTVTDGLRYEYYDLLAESVRSEGVLAATGAAATVAVEPRPLTSFRWELDSNGLVSNWEDDYDENAVVKLAGSVAGGVFSGVRYKMDQAAQLLHNEAWCVEIQLENWIASSGTMILSSSPSAAEGAPYIYFRPADFFVGIGCYNGSTYDNYGVSLKKHGITCSEGVHTYQFVNCVSDDGTNMIYLIVDNQEIGALTDHYINSTLTDKENTWLSGQDFAMPYLGTTTAPISNCTIHYIVVTETNYNPDMHLHDWSDWEMVSAPSVDGPGEEKRVCAGCDETQIREVEGVWQTHSLSEHMVPLPEKFCSGTNLWKILPHDAEYYHSGIQWAKHESGSVYSVTIEVNAGDKIFATSFGKYAENGNTIGTSNGIRVTFFDAEGVLKTMAPQETYAEFAANGGYIVAPEGTVAINIPMYGNSDSGVVYILNRDHCYENGICTGCGEADPNEVAEPLDLRYDDHYDVTGKTVEIVDAGKPTSYQVGYGVEENAVLDTAVVTLEGDYLVATGIGTAKVRIDGTLYEVTVTAAPISLLLLIGQSNMRGSEGNADQSIVCPDGMVYATFGDDRGDAEGIMNVNNATNFAASALTGAYSGINVNGTTDNLSYYPINSLTEDGKGTFGPDSGFAYEWVKQTGEKVWIVNAAHGGSSITSWQPNKTNYQEADLLFSACQETLRKEIAAGHFTLSHMGYFWCQGCSDYNWTAEKYVTQYLAMHNGLKDVLSFDHDSNADTADKMLEFAGIIPVRAGHDYNNGYREGVYTDTTTQRFYESFLDLQMTGPRVAQYWMINNPELSDIWGVCNVGEDWVWMPDGTNGVTEYFQAHYENGTVDYTTQVQQKAAWYTPTTPKEVHDSIHYNQIGYNEIGREAARNALIMLGEIQAPDVETTVEFVSWDGYSEVTTVDAYTEGKSDTLVVPKVYPIWKSKDVTYTLSDGLTWDYYDLLVENDGIGGTLSANGMTDRVSVTGHTWSDWETKSEASAVGPGVQQRVCSHCGKTDSRTVDGVWQIYDLAEHLQELPEGICGETNLWTMLPHEDVHFTSGKKWGKTSTATTSITIPVNPGDKIYATSWNKAGENGHATSDGIRLTFFDDKGIAQTLGPGESYRLFAANGGYLVAPEGSIALNVVMWYDSDEYEVYILNREHCYENGICTGCGEADPNEVAEPLDLRYDDHYDVTGKAVEIIDVGKPTSYQVGYGVEENKVLDTAVVTLEGNYLVATGIGTAKVRIDGVLYEVTVTAAPISLLLVIGQSNAEGMVGNANQSVACENGQVYSTYAKANGLTGDAGLTVENASNYVPSALTGPHSTVNVNGTDTKLSGHPVNSLTEEGSGKYGMDSGLAYEWTKQTGEKVWVVNAAHGASSISSWQPGQSDYEEAKALLGACQEVLMKEIAAGHYTFSRMGYYWCQGCADETKSAEWYVGQYLAMHEGLKTEFSFDGDLNVNTPDDTMEFGNIVLVMAGHENAAGYRTGTYTDSSDNFFASFKELEMRGPRVAQIWMANNPELEDIHIVCTLAQDWVTMPDGSDGVAEYFATHYENGVIDYPTQVKQSTSWYKPTTPAAVKNSIHYYQVGYNEVGRESVRNTLYILGLAEKPDVETTVTFVDWTGYQIADTVKTSTVASTNTLVVPMVYPCYESKNVTYSVSDNLIYSYYDLLDSGVDGGTLTASIGSQSVQVIGRDYYAYRFELDNGKMVSVSDSTFRENALTQYTGQKVFTTAEPIILKHDKPWRVEFNSVATDRFMALATTPSSTEGMFYFFKSASNSGVLSMGEYKDGKYQNYGLLQHKVDIDWNQPHVYRFQNVINEDGTNTVHIYIDDVWTCTATELIIDGASKGTGNMYLSGKDFAFTSVGCGGFGLSTGQMTYLEVWEDYHAHTYENGICTVCGAEEPVSHIPGDITGDGEVNNKDVARLFKYFSDYDVEVVEAALDVNGDGEIDNKDLTRLFRYLSGHDVTIY